MEILLEPWTDADLPLLRETLGDPQMMKHLGGVESEAAILARHERFLLPSNAGAMFTIRVDGERAGSIGFWEREWKGDRIYETGWMVLPRFGGRGVASTAALEIVRRARREARHRYLHAFPSVDNAASNAVCRRAGFTNMGASTFEYPKGSFMQCNDWRIDLSSME
jgi:RimJ/RimL family protein N-acetyltransferase